MKTKEQQDAYTVVQMSKELESLRKERDAYRNFTNAMDDYFEYRCISEVDQRQVHQMMGVLTERLFSTTLDKHTDT